MLSLERGLLTQQEKNTGVLPPSWAAPQDQPAGQQRCQLYVNVTRQGAPVLQVFSMASGGSSMSPQGQHGHSLDIKEEARGYLSKLNLA